ncbi:leucyl aminopeptidase [Tindallia californiensis]|uniref:Probable cytosol aminopeptidase n=1 Tax=Tindallia californiensis TaxID=159292 RepID=A0A1H3L462_9FIRM|nr:leucyl aminopeptidase [Tindallia californiensis]SDY59297.1 leucyl aminopeptidase [Tindallia californiensis]
MRIEVSAQKPEKMEVDLLAIALFEDSERSDSSFLAIDKALGGQLTEIFEEKSFCGKRDETTLIYTHQKIPVRKVLLIGMGKKDKIDVFTLKKAAAKAVKQSKKEKCAKLGFWNIEPLPFQAEEVGRFVSEGLVLGNYEFNQYKTKEKEEELTVSSCRIYTAIQDEKEKFLKGIEMGQSIGEAISLTRNLVNEPANKMTPENMALEAEAVARKKGMKIEVMGKEEIEKLGMGCFLGVAQGSEKEPKLVVMRYEGDPQNTDQMLGLVGKGLTFDSGGISLKPAAGMEEMKTDMAGAAAVLGTMAAIADIGPLANVVGILGICENMPSRSSYRPGDVLKSLSGQTVEVLNTDAEGRLVLADCLTFVERLGATHIIDVATLTGAVVVALGNHYTGVLSNDDDFQASVLDAGKMAGERLWAMPKDDVYKDQLKSDIADLSNVGGKGAGMITAGMFLEAFVEEKPWVHLDIAGTARTSEPVAYEQKGGTGSAVATLVQVACGFNKRNE